MEVPVQTDWAEIVANRFRSGPPNGWLEGWEVNRFHAELLELSGKLTLANHTSFDYAFCNLYEVEVPGSTSDVLWVLTIRISFIVDAFSLHWTRYECDGRQGAVRTPTISTCRTIEAEVRRFLQNRAFIEPSVADCDSRVTGVELELSDPDMVTLGKCLFQDYDG